VLLCSSAICNTHYLEPYVESSLVACARRTGTTRFTSSMCWHAESSTTVVNLLVPLSILANFASAFESSLQHALAAAFSHINSLTFQDNFTDIKEIMMNLFFNNNKTDSNSTDKESPRHVNIYILLIQSVYDIAATSFLRKILNYCIL